MTTAQLVLVITTALAVAAIVAGTVLAWGAALGLIVGGALALGGVVVLYDPDAKRKKK